MREDCCYRHQHSLSLREDYCYRHQHSLTVTVISIVSLTVISIVSPCERTTVNVISIVSTTCNEIYLHHMLSSSSNYTLCRCNILSHRLTELCHSVIRDTNHHHYGPCPDILCDSHTAWQNCVILSYVTLTITTMAAYICCDSHIA
ncbi:hypothetical protein ACOMHN_034850 [Nucella lapillus]